MAWSAAARAAAAEARRLKAAQAEARSARARAAHAGGSGAAQEKGRGQEAAVARMLRASARPANTAPVDVSLRSRGKAHGVEVKTLTEQKNNKITMNAYAIMRKLAYARSARAALHTVAVDLRGPKAVMYYRR